MESDIHPISFANDRPKNRKPQLCIKNYYKLQHEIHLAAYFPIVPIFELQLVDSLKVDPTFLTLTRIEYGVVGPTAIKPIEYMLVEEMVDKVPGIEDLLYKKLLSPDPRISAYCLIGLELIHSNLLQNLPPSLFERKETLQLMSGHFQFENEFGEFAKEVAVNERGCTCMEFQSMNLRAVRCNELKRRLCPSPLSASTTINPAFL